MPLQLRRGTQAELNALTEPLAEGELVYISGGIAPKLAVGDGTTPGGRLVIGFSNEEAKDAAGEAITSGTHSGITFTYNPSTRVINSQVDFSSVNIGQIRGSLLGNDSTVIVNGDTGVVNASQVNIGSANITASGSAITLPAGSTLAGTAFGIRVGTDDSTISTYVNNAVINILGGTGVATTTNEEGHVVITASSPRNVIPTLEAVTSTPHYVPFVANTATESEVRSNVNLRFIPSTNTLESTNIASTTLVASTSINSPQINTTNILAGTITANNTLSLTSNLNDGSNGSRLITVGTESVDGRFQVQTNSTLSGLSLVQFNQHHSTVDAVNVQFNRSRGTSASPTTVLTGDDVADLAFGAHDGTAYRVRAAISTVVDGTISTGVVPMRVEIATSVNGSGNPVTALTVDSKQQTTFAGAIRLVSYADSTARDAAITSPAAGMMIFITGTGKFQGYNGSSWDDLN